MHVGLNLVFLVPGETGGMEVAARELIPALVAAAPEVRFTAFINREAAEAGGGPWGELVEAVTVPVRARNRVEWVRGEQQHLPRLAARAGVDIVHSLASTSPGWGRFRRVVTVHDLIYRRYPDAHSGLRARGMSLLVPFGVRRAQRVIAVSASTRDDLVTMLGTPAAKVEVIPQGLGTTHAAEPLGANLVRDRFGLGSRRIVLSVSAKRAHKNLVRLLEALAGIPREKRPVLIVPGYPTDHETALRARAAELGIEDDVRWPAWVVGEELEGLYAAADCFVFPSLYEGFGLPVLEAMARGVPVACSNASSLPEVAGDAALQFDPYDTSAIRVAIERLLSEPELAQRLRGAGRARAATFTWDRTARMTLDAYRRVLATT